MQHKILTDRDFFSRLFPFPALPDAIFQLIQLTNRILLAGKENKNKYHYILIKAYKLHSWQVQDREYFAKIHCRSVFFWYHHIIATESIGKSLFWDKRFGFISCRQYSSCLAFLWENIMLYTDCTIFLQTN